jgi:DNA polymerase-3 subunit epsilon
MHFTAIDFETATGYRTSICQVGLVRVENDMVVKELCLLVQPPNNYYWLNWSDEIHHIYPADTANAPTLDKVWPLIRPFVEGQVVVAHNGPRFDFECIKQTLAHYGLPEPQYEKRCTYKIFKKNLADACKEHGVTLESHHHALADARACAALFLHARQLGLLAATGG